MGLTEEGDVQPPGRQRCLLVCSGWNWLLAAEGKSLGHRWAAQDLVKGAGTRVDRKPSSANAGRRPLEAAARRKPSGHWLPCGEDQEKMIAGKQSFAEPAEVARPSGDHVYWPHGTGEDLPWMSLPPYHWPLPLRCPLSTEKTYHWAWHKADA